VEAVLYHYGAGIPWRDLPERFGPYRKIHTRADERVIERLVQQGKTAVILPKHNRKTPRDDDRDLYKARHLIETLLCQRYG
jgi:transposase